MLRISRLDLRKEFSNIFIFEGEKGKNCRRKKVFFFDTSGGSLRMRKRFCKLGLVFLRCNILHGSRLIKRLNDILFSVEKVCGRELCFIGGFFEKLFSRVFEEMLCRTSESES